MMLEPVDTDLWLTEGPVVDFHGFPYPTRSIIVRLPDGKLWVWSPVALTPELKKAVDDINKSALADQSEAVFGIHEKTNRVTIKIVDKKTKEVIKEFPPEKTLDMIAKVWEMAGLMVDEKR